jgi:hypothetical protein
MILVVVSQVSLAVDLHEPFTLGRVSAPDFTPAASARVVDDIISTLSFRIH